MAENADKIKALHRKRGVILGGITSFSKKLDEWRDKEVDRDKYVLQQYLDSFVKGFDKFDPIQEELEDLDEREIDQRQVIQDRFDVAVARAKGLLSEYAVSDDGESTRSNNSASFQSAASSQNSDRHVKLPKIDLPKFDGTLENWASFYDLFSTLIDEDTALSASAKLHFLRSSCTGKAARLIESLTTKPENYESALKLLKKKFDSPRRALRAHWTKLREYPKSPKDTPTSLGELVDLFNQNLKAMENLGAPVDQWSVPLIDLILTKISPYTAWQWELTLDETDNKMPCYTHLLSFLERRASSVELSNFDSACKNVAKVSYRSNYNNNSSPVPSVKKPAQNFSATSAPAKSDKKKTCPLCSEPHPLYWCDQFKSMSTEDRKITAQRESLCMNCLGNHTGLCKSKHRCKICKNNTHHTLLCCQNSEKPQPESPKFAGVINTPTSELITTALVNVSNYDGKSVLARALVDTCSSMHFMTINLAQRLGLKVRKDPSPISVLNSITTISGGTVSAIIRSRYNGYERELTFRTVDQITGLVPDQPIDRRLMKIPSNIRLADPEFHRPAPAEILIASGTALSMLCQGQINLSQPGGLDLYLQKTMLGWVIGGSVPSESAQSMASCHLVTLNFDLKQFWEREEVPQMEVLTKCKNEEEALCEEHFRSNITRNSEGRYVVALPFNERVTELRESRSMAEKRLAGLKRRLQLNPELKEKYCSVMKEYLTLGHMSPVEVRGGEKGYYLPHHAVTKDSLTTAVRVVYDGSAKTFPDGPSLNETLRVGPTIQPDLFSQLLKFRIHNTVLTGDIEKMYRQFLVRKQDRKYQRILWPDAEGRTQTYELNTVTFGLAPASFLAIRCLHQLAEDEGKNFPLAAEVLKNEFYVDNALTGAPTVTAAVLLRQQLTEILSRAGINIYQWASNVPEVLHDLPPEKINKQLVLSNSTISTLGLKWDANSDSITYTVANLPLNHIVTKRSILSEISKIFDPLGLLGPVIIYAKILIQELWKLKLHWDESLTSSLRQVWLKYRHQLSLLDHLSFGRKILIEHPVRVELHSFGDAGTKAYGCCLYVRSIDVHGNILTTLLCAKSRVAPIKTVSIPRLELCAARLLADVSTSVKEQIPINFDQIFYWTDSTVVLNWLHTYPASLQVFVANRVAEIQTKTDIKNWGFVRTFDNPADLMTRGQLPKNFLKESIWQHGPPWLSHPESEWPVSNFLAEPNNVLEKKKVQCFAVTTFDPSLFQKFSCIFKLQKIIALCKRMKNKNKHGHVLLDAAREVAIKNSGTTVTELNLALKTIMNTVQNSNFNEEMHYLKKGEPVPSHSRLQPLNPFLDKDGLIRVGGRLKNAALPFEQRHPLILPKDNHVTRLLIEAEHTIHGHAGIQATLYALRRRFWVLDGRNTIRKILRQCVHCAKLKPVSVDYLMGDLPAARVTPARPFSRVGIDLCGYFFLKEKKYRNRNQVKAYVVVFVCFVTKAVHLELVTDLSSDSFIAALRRFIARRGLCSDIYSDNATNFLGTNNQMKELETLFSDSKHQNSVHAFAAKNCIRWHFIPAKSPHFGGLWESAVKSFKHHLLRVVKGALFTYEEFYTFCTEIEAILNSRPISPMSSDPNDLLALTPGHFLIGDSLTSLPDLELRDTPVNRLSQWQHIQQVKQHFWSRWQQEYLNELTVRHKWTKDMPGIQTGALVLLQDEKLPPLQWNMGRVVQCHPGPDNVTRVVTVKTANGTFRRSTKKVSPLPIENSIVGRN